MRRQCLEQKQNTFVPSQTTKMKNTYKARIVNEKMNTVRETEIVFANSKREAANILGVPTESVFFCGRAKSPVSEAILSAEMNTPLSKWNVHKVVRCHTRTKPRARSESFVARQKEQQKSKNKKEGKK
jgi:hypothetical protein